MNIFNLLSQNFGHGSRTRKPDDAVPYPSGFRGRLLHNIDLCTTCGTCVYSCSPGAITIDDDGSNIAEWDYQEDRCTFCGFCVQYCPTHALSFEKVSPEPINERVEHYQFHEIEYQPCRMCHKSARILPEASLEQIYGSPLPEEIEETIGLCENCRQKLTSKRFLKAFIVKGDRQDE
jgi:ferredoxin